MMFIWEKAQIIVSQFPFLIKKGDDFFGSKIEPQNHNTDVIFPSFSINFKGIIKEWLEQGYRYSNGKKNYQGIFK